MARIRSKSHREVARLMCQPAERVYETHPAVFKNAKTLPRTNSYPMQVCLKYADTQGITAATAALGRCLDPVSVTYRALFFLSRAKGSFRAWGVCTVAR